MRQRQAGNPMRLVIQVFLFGFAVASLLFLVTWQLFLDSGSVPAIGGAYDAVIDTSGGTSLNPPVKAQRVENPGQAVPETNSQTP